MSVVVIEDFTIERQVSAVKVHFKYGENYAETPWNPESKWCTQRVNCSEMYQKIRKTRPVSNVKSPWVNGFCRVDDENIAIVSDRVWISKSDTMSSTTLGPLENFKILIKKTPKMHAYKIQLTRDLKPSDYTKRTRFVE